MNKPVPPIRQFAPDVPEELAAIIDRMLAKNPGDRFATPAEVAAGLEPFSTDANLAKLLAAAEAVPAPSDRAAISSPLPPGEG